MAKCAFGNDPAKIERYKAFWKRDAALRPLMGFTFIGWFPLGDFSVFRIGTDECVHGGTHERVRGGTDGCVHEGTHSSVPQYLEPEMVDPEEFMEDHLRLLAEGEAVDDDMIRGACPAQVAVPWLPGMVGSKLRILPENVLGEERRLPWEEALAIRLDRENPWFKKYMEFADALVRVSAGRFPVSHSAELGPTDLHAIVRGHSESLLDLTDEPEKSAQLLWQMGEVFRDATEAIWERLPLFHGGYFDAQYSLWAPGPTIRMQEDATAVYSPALYRKFVQPVDRMLAKHFASSFIHLHSTSMFLLDAILEIDEIQCYEINNDACGPPLEKMVPYFRRVQAAEKPLLIRGTLTEDELRLLLDRLDPCGLFLNVMVKEMREVEKLRGIVGM